MRKVLLFFISCLLLLSCKDSYNYVSRKGTLPQKYEYAKKYFDKKKYSKSQPLLEEIYPQYKGKKEAEHTFLVFATGHVIFTSAGSDMETVFHTFITLMIENRAHFEEQKL